MPVVVVQVVKRTWILEPDVLRYLSPVRWWVSGLGTLFLSIADKDTTTYFTGLFGGLDVT